MYFRVQVSTRADVSWKYCGDDYPSLEEALRGAQQEVFPGDVYRIVSSSLTRGNDDFLDD